MNISVSASAQPGPLTVTVASGLQLSALTSVVQILPYTASTATLHAPVTNLATGLEGVPGGGTAVISTSGLPANLTGWTLSISDAKASFTVGSNQILAAVPSGASVGLALVKLTPPSGDGGPPPILMRIDPPPPVITSILNVSGLPVDAAHAALAGDSIIAVVAGLTDSASAFQPSLLKVTVGQVEQAVQSVQQAALPGSSAVKFTLLPSTPAGLQPVVVSYDTRVSAALPMMVRASDNN